MKAGNLLKSPMTLHESMPRPRRSRWLTLAAGTVLGLVLLGGLASGWPTLSAYAGYLRYRPQEGDVVFQSLPHGDVVTAIEGVTESPYSHCGIVARQEGRWVVYEALGKVRVTPLQEFFFRGRDSGLVVYRLRAEHRGHIPETLKCCQAYLGRPYDTRYGFDDKAIYCSELVWKAYRDATDGQRLGEPRKFGDMNWRPFAALIEEIEGGEVPVDREMITPRDLARAKQLEPVFSQGLQIEAAGKAD